MGSIPFARTQKENHHRFSFFVRAGTHSSFLILHIFIHIIILKNIAYVSANILGGGLWRMLAPLVYALMIYLLSILISTFQKPRI